jgi:ubiquinone/menaquinone biosynthesis C-methylase UbiE
MVERLSHPDRLAELSPERILTAAGISPASIRTVIDLGAGPGLIARGVSKLLPGATLYALDVSQELIDYLRGELTPEERTRIRPQQTAEARIDFDDDSVDFLFMVDVYHELADAPALLAEAQRVLRSGATLLVVDWTPDGTSGGPPDAHRVPPEVVEREMAAAGFTGVARSSVFTQHHAVRGLAR